MALLDGRACRMVAESGGPGWKQPCLRPRLGIPPCRSSVGGWKTRFISPWQDGILLPIPARGAARMTLYGYARVSVREPEDKNLDLQVERLVRAGCSLGNIRAEEASGARNDRDGLLELLEPGGRGGHPGGHPH